MVKILQWLGKNSASILGITQAVLKCLKEILTALVNLFSILNLDKAQEVVEKIRAIINKIDEIVEKSKNFFLEIDVLL